MNGKDKSKYKSSKSKTFNKSKTKSSKRNNFNESDDRRLSGDINDASYYFASDDLKRQLTHISFNQFTGVPNDLGSYVTPAGLALAKDIVPYAMRIELSPSAGYTGGDYTALGTSLNLAALNLYTTLSANNAKTSNYAPQDLTTLILAYGNILALSSHITRIFGLSYLYNMRNRAFPREIIEAAGCDYDDLIANLAEYRIEFNNLMVSLSKIPIPASIPYFKKCAELYHGLYWDMEGTDMAQTYLFVPGTVWVLDETYSEQGTGLRTIPVLDPQFVDETPTMAQYIGTLRGMIGALLNSTTLNAIYSDILRVSQKEGVALYQLNTIPENYVVMPAYKPEIRRWINNATIFGYPVGEPIAENASEYNDVMPQVDYNRIKYEPEFHSGQGGLALDFYVNFDAPNPSDDEIIEATRLASRCTMKYDTSTNTYYTEQVALPDHYVNRIVVFTSTGPVEVQSSTNWGSVVYRAFSDFDWSPFLYAIDNTGFVGSFGDLNYYTTLDFEYMSRLHDATYLGLFTIR